MFTLRDWLLLIINFLQVNDIIFTCLPLTCLSWDELSRMNKQLSCLCMPRSHCMCSLWRNYSIFKNIEDWQCRLKDIFQFGVVCLLSIELWKRNTKRLLQMQYIRISPSKLRNWIHIAKHIYRLSFLTERYAD